MTPIWLQFLLQIIAVKPLASGVCGRYRRWPAYPYIATVFAANFPPWLASVFVVPEWRGKGIASALVKRVEAEAAAHGFERIYLYTPDQQALYRRLGWQDREDVEYRKEHVTVMERQLGQ